jgi:hypothetical protein
MGILGFLTGDGQLGEMVRNVGGLFNKIKSEPAANDLERFIGLVYFRYVNSNNANGRIYRTVVISNLGTTIERGETLGLIDVCYYIAAAETDISGKEQDVLKIIEKNLSKMNFSQMQIYGGKYSGDDFRAFSDKYRSIY